jgi:hypothetical protein
MTYRGWAACLFVCALVGGLPSDAYAFNEPTHDLINVHAVRASQTDSIMRALGFSDGIRTSFDDGRGRTKRAEEWLGEGGRREDHPLCRTARHFHNPLYQADGSGIAPWNGTWENAGLRTLNILIVIPCGATSFASSVRWAQEANQAAGEQRAWQVARDAYWQALTGLTRAAREQAFADTFLTLGQQMHLVADASVPEHVRHDSHLLESACRMVRLTCYGSYEWWVTDEQGRSEPQFIQRYLAAPRGPDPAILRPTGDPAAPVPTARLIDTDTYGGTDPNATLGNAIGIAEVAHANFFSEDTTGGDPQSPNPPFPFPNAAATVPSTHPAPRTGHVRAYRAKGANDGLYIDPVLAECVLDEPAAGDAIIQRAYLCTDEAVWERVATEMLPRAVGYSAALLDYFFRGKVDPYFSPPSPTDWRSPLRVINRTENERMTGTFSLHYDGVDGHRHEWVRWPDIDLEPGTTSGPLAIPDLPAGLPLPAEPGRYLLVFRGRLGNEPDGIAATWVDGRVWMLWSTSLIRDHTVTFGGPTFPPTTLPAGPVLSGSVWAVDPVFVFDGANYVVTAAAGYQQAVEYLFACGGSDYTPSLVDVLRTDQQLLMAWHRGPAALRGDSATVEAVGQTLTLSVVGQGYNVASGPVSLEVVRFVAPRSPQEMQQYTPLNPPVVEAVLKAVEVNSQFDFVDLGPIDLQGAAFVGVRLTTPLPGYPGVITPSGIGGFLDPICFQQILPRFGPIGDVMHGGAWGHGPQATIQLRIQPTP